MTEQKKARKPREKKVRPHPLAGINPELDALVALTPWPLDDGNINHAEVNLIAAASAKVADLFAVAKHQHAQGEDGFDAMRDGATILRALESYVDAQGIY